MKEDIARSHLT